MVAQNGKPRRGDIKDQSNVAPPGLAVQIWPAIQGLTSLATRLGPSGADGTCIMLLCAGLGSNDRRAPRPSVRPCSPQAKTQGVPPSNVTVQTLPVVTHVPTHLDPHGRK